VTREQRREERRSNRLSTAKDAEQVEERLLGKRRAYKEGTGKNERYVIFVIPVRYS